MVERKKIIWGLIADKQLKKAIKFHFEKTSSTRYSLKLLDELEHTINLIEQYNEIGIALPKTNFRFISVFMYSIVYEVEEDSISILLFWDTRRNPKTLKVLLEELS